MKEWLRTWTIGWWFLVGTLLLGATWVGADPADRYGKQAIKIADISEGRFDDAPALSITFSVPVDPNKDFNRYLRVSYWGKGVSKQNAVPAPGSWVLSDTGTRAYFPNTEPDHHYHITVFKGLAAMNGRTLSKKKQQEVATRPLAPSVSFASSGHLLPITAAGGLPVISVNVDEADIDFHRIKAGHIPQFLSQWYQRSSFSTWRLERFQPHVELVHSGRFSLNPPKNRRHRLGIDVLSIDELTEPGVYLAVMKGAGTYPNSYPATYFVVTDLGLHARYDVDSLRIYANQLSDAQSIADVKLTLLDIKGRELASQLTGPKGLAVFTLPATDARILLAEKQSQMAILPLQGPMLDMSGFDLGGRSQRSLEAYLYGPRDLFRPGEQLTFSALLRDGDGRVKGKPVLNATLTSPDGREMDRQTLAGDDLAHYRYQFALPDNAATGRWNLALSLGKQTVGELSFLVEAFMPERMELTLDDGAEKARFIGLADPLTVPVKGDYLYGAPASGNRLSSMLWLQPERHPLPSWPDYQFGRLDEMERPEKIELDEIHLDASGRGVVGLASQWQKASSPLQLKLSASLEESGGRPVTRQIRYTLWPAQTMVGILPVFKPNQLAANGLANFQLVAVDQQGQQQVAKGLDVRLIHERRDYYWLFNESRGWHMQTNDRHYTVFESKFAIDGKKPAKLQLPVEWGRYRLEVENPATGLVTSLRFQAGYGWAQQSDQQRPDSVAMTLDKPGYNAGDVAQLTVNAPHSGRGFVVVEGERALWWQPVELDEGESTLSIPIDPSWRRHDLYVSLVLIRPAAKSEQYTPNRAVGLIHLPMNRRDRQLSVSLKPAADKWEPQQPLPVSVQVEGMAVGEPAKVTLAAVDVGVLNITDFDTPDAHQWLFSQRRYGIRSRDVYGAIIEAAREQQALQRFGGDAELSRGGKEAASEVQIVSWISEPLSLDANGHVDVDVPIPDFNGRIRLMALAFSEADYGHQDAEVTVAAPLVAELSAPRFLAGGDRASLALDLHNLSGAEAEVEVSVTANGRLQMAPLQQTLPLADGEKQVLRLDVTARVGDFGQGDIAVEVSGAGRGVIKRQWTLGVRPAYPIQHLLQRRQLQTGEQWQLPVATAKDWVGVEARLNLDRYPALDMAGQLQHLFVYPYGCLEQTTSRLWPWLDVDADVIDKLQLKQTLDKRVGLDQQDKILASGLTRLRELQLRNGAFGLWGPDSPEEHWLTVYATEFLLRARDQGQTVEADLLDPALRRLVAYVRRNEASLGERWSENPDHYRFAYRSYAAYVLSTINRAPLASLRTLYDHHRQWDQTGLPTLHLGLALLAQGDQLHGEAAIVEAIDTVKALSERYYYGDYGSRVRDLAWMHSLLQTPLVPESQRHGVIVALADALQQRQYLSTQDRGALWRAGLAMYRNPSDWQAQVIDAQGRQQFDQQGARSWLLDPALLAADVHIEADSSLYAMFELQGYPTEAPSAEQQGPLHIERQWYDLDGQRWGDVGEQLSLSSGELRLVHLRIWSEKRVPDALVVDLLPAGFEIENPNLRQAASVDDLAIDGVAIAELRGRGQLLYQGFRDDRYIAAVNLWPSQETHLFYLVRAVTPGQYQVPMPLVEDMYRPHWRAQGLAPAALQVLAPTDSASLSELAPADRPVATAPLAKPLAVASATNSDTPSPDITNSD